MFDNFGNGSFENSRKALFRFCLIIIVLDWLNVDLTELVIFGVKPVNAASQINILACTVFLYLLVNFAIRAYFMHSVLNSLYQHAVKNVSDYKEAVKDWRTHLYHTERAPNIPEGFEPPKLSKSDHFIKSKEPPPLNPKQIEERIGRRNQLESAIQIARNKLTEFWYLEIGPVVIGLVGLLTILIF